MTRIHTPAVRLINISKSFGNKEIFRDFSCSFEHGNKYCIMGESGCGKTTLLNMLMSVVTPDSGEISGVPHNISAVFQEDRLCESFSAVGNILAVTGNKVPEEEIIYCLSELGLSGNENVPVSTLSGGMRRRVAIARALLAESELILLDEPFTGLDDETKETVIKVILVYTKGKTLVAVTHDRSDAELLCAEILRL